MALIEIPLTLFPAASGSSAHVLVRPVFIPVDLTAAQLLSAELATVLLCVPVDRHGPVLTVAMVDAGDLALLQCLQALTGLRIRPVTASPAILREALRHVYELAACRSPFSRPLGLAL